MSGNGSYKFTTYNAVLALIVAIIPAVITFYLGKSKGAEGKKPGFDQISTQVNLDGSRWNVEYEDIGTESAAVKRTAVVKFDQFGSRIIGEGQDSTGREWIVEGAAADRRVCYIYYDTGGQRLSFGAVILEMNNAGTEMTGQWTGWSPESNKPQPRSVILRKLNA